MLKASAITFTLLLTACGDRPHEVLTKKGRPTPIECVRTGNYQETCKDGSGVIWTCGTGGGEDATCMVTGQLPVEGK